MRWFLLLVPAAIGVTLLAPDQPLLVFISCVLALIPLAAMLGEATEHVAAHVGSSIGGLLNATFGNLAELIILTAMLSRGLHEIVLAGILGGILVNALFASGLSMTIGGLRQHVQEYNRDSARDMATLLSIAAFGLAVISVIDIRQSDGAAPNAHFTHGHQRSPHSCSADTCCSSSIRCTRIKTCSRAAAKRASPTHGV